MYRTVPPTWRTAVPAPPKHRVEVAQSVAEARRPNCRPASPVLIRIPPSRSVCHAPGVARYEYETGFRAPAPEAQGRCPFVPPPRIRPSPSVSPQAMRLRSRHRCPDRSRKALLLPVVGRSVRPQGRDRAGSRKSRRVSFATLFRRCQRRSKSH